MIFPLDISYILKSLGGKQSPARRERAKNSGHYQNGIFVNSIPTRKLLPGTFLELLRQQFFGKEERIPLRAVPLKNPSAKDFQAKQKLRATWLGHASVLLEIDGRVILTDPVWSQRCSPSQKIGPKRFFPPPLALEDLPKIDSVLISHDHYDHLDMDTVVALAKTGVKFLVPLGVGAHLEHWKIPQSQIVEMNWHESEACGDLVITATPARHFSGRGLRDENKTLWASFVIAGPDHKVFFSGDSGYFPDYEQLGKTHGPFQLTLMQIGACSAYWPDIHMMPDQAIQAHLDLKGDLFLPIHWGTFNLAFHAWNEPVMSMLKAAKIKGVRTVTPKPGQIVEVEQNQTFEPWWE